MILLTPTSSYPCQWDDLIDSKRNLVVTIYTLKEFGMNESEAVRGITLSEDGIYDIVIDVPVLTLEVVSNALAELSEFSGQEFALRPL